MDIEMISSSGKRQYGIITINDITGNYGNRLQNYALQRLLSSKGDATTIAHYLEIPDTKTLLKSKIHDVVRCKENSPEAYAAS